MPSDNAAAPILPLALTMGDPAGIGLDITLSAWLVRSREMVPPFACFADAAKLSERARHLGWTIPIREISLVSEASRLFADALPVVQIATASPVIPGKPNPSNAAATIASIDLAVSQAISGNAAAVVTNPIAKSVLYTDGFSHPGHTEYLAHLAERATPGSSFRPVMMLASRELRVVPVTIHIPLSAVPAALTKEAIRTAIETTAESLRRDFAIPAPRIAVAGLNPHAGEDGSIGTEDRDLIAPLIASMRAHGFDVTGPHPADTMFHPAARARYDAAICMYHDQALIPIKTLAFDTGVNVTLGLPFVRTSPDHGTAFDIAGKGTASAASLIEALKLAQRMSMMRTAATVPS